MRSERQPGSAVKGGMLPAANAWTAGAVDERLALCDAALTLLIDNGIARFDLCQVDERASLPAGTCRTHFHSQGELLAALLERTAGLYHSELRAIRDRHPEDIVACIVDWLSFVAGPARDRSRVVWALMLDPGTRAQVSMYVDALAISWERQVADVLDLPVAQVRVAWAMVEGWVGRSLIHDLPVPPADALAALVRALLGAHDAGRADGSSATVGG